MSVLGPISLEKCGHPADITFLRANSNSPRRGFSESVAAWFARGLWPRVRLRSSHAGHTSRDDLARTRSMVVMARHGVGPGAVVGIQTTLAWARS